MVSETARKTIATVYTRRSAKERQALRREAYKDVFRRWITYPTPRPECWPFTTQVVNPHKYGGDLRLDYQGRSVSVPFYFLGVSGTYLIPHTRINDIILALYKLVGFNRGHDTLWHFEIKDRAEHNPVFRELLGLIVSSIADVHITQDGVIFRVYTLNNEVLVEHKKEGQGYVTVSGVEHFLKLQGGEVPDAA